MLFLFQSRHVRRIPNLFFIKKFSHARCCTKDAEIWCGYIRCGYFTCGYLRWGYCEYARGRSRREELAVL